VTRRLDTWTRLRLVPLFRGCVTVGSGSSSSLSAPADRVSCLKSIGISVADLGNPYFVQFSWEREPVGLSKEATERSVAGEPR